ncbi:extracellular solute-binding protein [Aquibaculum arenosum]|uniref:Putrescine-binding periplasmic protein n=1 Tax=Aquibaculum arenosum TaxID=3032591 RepID=A0ABT5YJ97_9PROT|nr:extracellular solute-binding protein [Fodinicurvata sp. CAU 1616]MDF2095015.1 extracellular solute-binding protein [Fodinicurvata sp. CAU 1616]
MNRKAILSAGIAAGLFAGLAQSASAEELFLYNWSNYFPPELLEKFESDTGISVTLDVYDSNETMLARLQAGAAGYDIVVPSDYMMEIMIKEGLAERIDAGEMENFSNVMEPHNDPRQDPGRAYSAPYLWGTTGFTYDSERVGELEESWKEFFEPREELSGQIAVLNDEVEAYNAAAYYAGVSKCTEEPAEAQQILDILQAQAPHVAMYQSDGTIDRMASGEMIMHMQWNGAAHRSKQERDSLVYVYPEEGISFWNDNFMVPAGAPNLENAKTFINWMMAPENIAVASNYTGYMNAVRGSSEFMDEALVEDPAVNMPEEYADRLRPTEDCSVDARELRNRVWTRLRS